jgi:succinate dehydrogenase / fumarate reductase, cytochrome b subunit
MAGTGLLLVGFLTTHLLGNALLFTGPDLFNEYAHKLSSTPLIYGAEAILALIFLAHAYYGIRLYLRNRAARPVGYAIEPQSGDQTLGSRTMIWSGLVVLAFLVLHIVTFKFGKAFTLPGGMKDLWTLVVTRFTAPWYSAIYIVSVLLLGAHLSHAAQSAIRTLGITRAGFRTGLRRLSWVLAIFFTLGFVSFPVYFVINGNKALNKYRPGAAAAAGKLEKEGPLKKPTPDEFATPNLLDDP